MDETRAAALFRKACEAGSAASCAAHRELAAGTVSVPPSISALTSVADFSLSTARMTEEMDERRAFELLEGDLISRALGREVRKDEAAAAGLFEICCERGLANSCATLGALYLDGRGVGRDPARGAELIRKAVRIYESECNEKAPHSCLGLGDILARGQGIPKDAARAAAVHERAAGIFRAECDGAIAWDCIQLGDLYAKGERLAKDPERAHALFARMAAIWQKECDTGTVKSCTDLAEEYTDGRRLSRDAARAGALYAKVAALLQERCDAGDGESCDAFGDLLQWGKGGLIPDSEQALVYYKKGCDAGNFSACQHLETYKP